MNDDKIYEEWLNIAKSVCNKYGVPVDKMSPSDLVSEAYIKEARYAKCDPFDVPLGGVRNCMKQIVGDLHKKASTTRETRILDYGEDMQYKFGQYLGCL